MPVTVCITGVAGFIGSHVAQALLEQGYSVLGIDSEQSFPSLAMLRLAPLKAYPQFHYVCMNLLERPVLADLIESYPTIEIVIHLAARGGVRQSQSDPHAYIDDNVVTQVNILEACRGLPALKQIFYASSSAVYGPSASVPFVESMPVGGQASFYATTKRMNELTAYTYNHLYGLPLVGLRFFTVYGPRGRPDMACYSFARAIRDGRPLSLWAEANLSRDFTYIDDVVRAILGLMERPVEWGTYQLFNVGFGRPHLVSDLIALLERTLDQTAQIQLAPKPREDMVTTWADNNALRTACSWSPSVSLEDGVERFAAWFLRFSPI